MRKKRKTVAPSSGGSGVSGSRDGPKGDEEVPLPLGPRVQRGPLPAAPRRVRLLLRHRAGRDPAGLRERSVKIKLKIKKTYFENKSNTILKIKDLAAKIK